MIFALVFVIVALASSEMKPATPTVCVSTEGLSCAEGICFNDTHLCIQRPDVQTTTIVIDIDVTTRAAPPNHLASIVIWTTALLSVVLLIAAPCTFVCVWYRLYSLSHTAINLRNRLRALVTTRPRRGYEDLIQMEENTQLPGPSTSNAIGDDADAATLCYLTKLVIDGKLPPFEVVKKDATTATIRLQDLRDAGPSGPKIE